MASQRVVSFLDQLKELLPPDQLSEVQRHALALSDDPAPLAKELVHKGWLTSYQANQLLQGRGGELVLGSYHVLDRLGEGGMGQVFRARHRTMGRTVALKMIRKEKLSSPVAVQRFQQEIRAAAQLAHPNIVVAYDAGQVGETHFFAMEYVEGVSLSRLVKESGPLPVAEACAYVRQAALGLQHAHERGLVHRDIKPDNLLLARGNGSATIKILDMGLARLRGPADDPARNVTRAGTVIGTPEYLAPEQALDARAVDIRADLYSLGCTFFFLLTGRPPFRGATLPEIFLMHQSDPPPPLSDFRADVPPAVEAIVRKLLAKRPDERFQTPEALAAALAPFVKKTSRTSKAIRPTRNGHVSPLTPVIARLPLTWRPALSRSQLVAAGSAAVFLVGVFLLAVFWLLAPEKSPPDSAKSKRTPTVITALPPKGSGTVVSTREEPKPPEPPPAEPDPSGTWRWKVSFGDRSSFATARLRLENGRLVGSYISPRDGRESQLEDGSYVDGVVSFRVVRGKFSMSFQGRLMGDTIRGTFDINFSTRDWVAERIGP
jgi:serine/threonine-protein kinase